VSQEDVARAWVDWWRELPVLDGETLDAWLNREGLAVMETIDGELVEVLAEAFEVFDELDRAAPGAVTAPGDASIRSVATVIWTRAHGITARDQRGRPAMAPHGRPSWFRGWLRYRWGRGAPVWWGDRAARAAALEAFRGGMAVWFALGQSEAFRDSFSTDEGIDLAPLLLPVLGRAVERAYPDAVGRAAAPTHPSPSRPPGSAPEDGG
jgi:hypothetical protein